jgi:CheY-like chemotaxis protein
MKPRVLVFDDDPAIRRILSMVLGSRGYEVVTYSEPGLCPLHVEKKCTCGSETSCTDVILSDLDMPNVRGLDFVETLMSKGCRCRSVALMSGGWTQKEMDRAVEIGCKVFSKPFNPHDVADWIDQCAAKLAPERQLNDRCFTSGSTVK